MAKPGSRAGRSVAAGSRKNHRDEPAIVDTSGLERVCAEFDAMAAIDPQAAVWQLARELPPELAQVRRQLCGLPQARLQPVAVNGSRQRGMAEGWFQTPLRDGTVGYLQRRLDDCVQAGLASLLQISPHSIPDFHFDAQMMAGKEYDEVVRHNEALLGRWAREAGVTIRIHPRPPVSERRWIGITAGGGLGDDHCLLMSKRDFLFDTANQQPWEPDLAIFSPEDIAWGITIERQ